LQQKNKHQTRLLITLFADILQGELKKNYIPKRYLLEYLHTLFWLTSL